LNDACAVTDDYAYARQLFSRGDIEFAVDDRAIALDARQRKSVSAKAASETVDVEPDAAGRDAADTESATGADRCEILTTAHSAAPRRPRRLSRLAATRVGRE
jgi:hypothetical protein